MSRLFSAVARACARVQERLNPGPRGRTGGVGSPGLAAGPGWFLQPRRRLPVVVGFGLVLVGWLVVRWAAPSGERPDTAPLDLRGKPIRALPATNASDREVAPDPATSARSSVGSRRGSGAAEASPSAGANLAGPDAAPPALPGVSPGRGVMAEGPEADGFLVVGFDRLSGFSYPMPAQPLAAGTKPEALAEGIPADIRALDGRKVAVKGFMLPMKLEDGRATELLLMRDQSMCCFGVVPNINDWINVTMARGVKPVMDQPVTIAGTLRVAAVVENDYLVCIYAMAGERLTTALDE